MTILRDINKIVNGKLDSSDPRIGVLASEIPGGPTNPAFLFNDVDPDKPNRLYNLSIVSLPEKGELYLDKRGAGYFKDAPAGIYTGNQIIEKYDPGLGRVSSAYSTYNLKVEQVIIPDPDPIVEQVIISPKTANSSQQFTYQLIGLHNPPQDVIWTKDGPGELSNTGYFTAPAPAIVQQATTITVTSVYDPTKKDSAIVLIPALVVEENPPKVTGIVITPSTVTLAGGATQQFNADVQGTGEIIEAVIWSIDKGSINGFGLATMPAAVLEPQNVEITATSVQDPTVKAKVTVYVLPMDAPNPDTIVVPPARILRTAADNYLERLGYTGNGDTFYVSQGNWCIDKDVDDKLYYALDIEPYLIAAHTGISAVHVLNMGVNVDGTNGGALIRGPLLIVKVGGGNVSQDINAANFVTFRIFFTNGEVLDRTIFFVMKDH